MRSLKSGRKRDEETEVKLGSWTNLTCSTHIHTHTHTGTNLTGIASQFATQNTVSAIRSS